MSLPGSLLRTIDAMDPVRGWALMLRHAEREEISHDSFGNEVGLTSLGREQSRELGRRLRGRLAGTTSSPLPRCMETARQVSRCAGFDAEPDSNCLLGGHGAFIVDAEAAGSAFRTLGLKGLVNRLLEPGMPPEGMRPVAAGCADLLSLVRDVMPPADKVHLLVTHDAILAPLLAILAGDRVTDEHWPEYLEGAALSWDGRDLDCVVAGTRRRICDAPCVSGTSGERQCVVRDAALGTSRR